MITLNTIFQRAGPAYRAQPDVVIAPVLTEGLFQPTDTFDIAAQLGQTDTHLECGAALPAHQFGFAHQLIVGDIEEAAAVIRWHRGTRRTQQAKQRQAAQARLQVPHRGIERGHRVGLHAGAAVQHDLAPHAVPCLHGFAGSRADQAFGERDQHRLRGPHHRQVEGAHIANPALTRFGKYFHGDIAKPADGAHRRADGLVDRVKHHARANGGNGSVTVSLHGYCAAGWAAARMRLTSISQRCTSWRT